MLTIVLTGIVYLLAYGDHTEMIVPNEGGQSPLLSSHQEHIAYIKIAIDDLDAYNPETGTRPADFIFTPKQGASKRFVVYLLRGDRITISGPMLESPPLRYKREGNGMCDRDNASRRGVECLPARIKVCPDCNHHDAQYSTTQRDGRLVSAQMMLSRGLLSAGKVADIQWTFEPMKRKFSDVTYHKQRMAEEVFWEVTATDDDFTLTISPFDGIASKEVVLKFKKNVSRSDVEIGSLPVINLLRVPTLDHFDTEDHHFAAYYRMMREPLPKDPPIPHQPPHPSSVMASSLGANCPPMIDFDP